MSNWVRNHQIGLERRQFLINYINDLGSKLKEGSLICRLLDDDSRINAIRSLINIRRKPSRNKISKGKSLAILCIDNKNRYVVIEVRMFVKRYQTSFTYFHFKKCHTFLQVKGQISKIYFLIIFNAHFILISGEELVTKNKVLRDEKFNSKVYLDLSEYTPHIPIDGGGILTNYGNIAEEIMKIL